MTIIRYGGGLVKKLACVLLGEVIGMGSGTMSKMLGEWTGWIPSDCYDYESTCGVNMVNPKFGQQRAA